MKPMLPLVAIGVVLIGMVGYNLIYVPQQRETGLIEKKTAQERAHQQTQTEVSALLTQLEAYRKRLSPEPDPSWLVRRVVEFCREAGIEITTISQESPQPLQQFTRLIVNLQFTATYHQLGAFLDIVERSAQFIRVDDLQVDRPSQDGGRAAIRLKFSTLYYIPQDLIASIKSSGAKK